MDAQSSPTPQAFLALLERNVSIKIVASSWCPTMDIVVLVTADGQLQLFRLNWERLWSLETKQSGSSITCLEWSPLGKHVAYGDEEGNVVVLAAEDGSVVERRQVFSRGSSLSAVVGLSWTISKLDASPTRKENMKNSNVPYRSSRLSRSSRSSRSCRLLEAGWDEVSSRGFSACIGTEESTHGYCVTPASHASHDARGEWEKRSARRVTGEEEALSFLCAMNARGDGVVCGEGLLPVLAFRIFPDDIVKNFDDIHRDTSREKRRAVKAACMRMSSTAERVYVGWKDEGGMHVSIVDTSVVRQEAVMVRGIIEMLSETLKDVRLVYDVMRNVQGHVAEVEAAREEHLDQMRAILGNIRDPERDIYDFLVRGAYSLELKAFVAKEVALKAAARRVDSVMACMYHDIVYHLQPCLERIAFRLGDVRGYSMTPSGARVLGLRPEAVGQAERWVLDFVAMGEHVRELVLKAASGYRNLYALMSMLQHREMGETYPSLPKSAIQEVEELIAARFYSAELGAAVSCVFDAGIADGMGCMGAAASERPDSDQQHVNERDDVRLFAAVFASACGLHVEANGGQGHLRNDRYLDNAVDEQKDDDTTLEHLLLGLERWLDGGTSAEHMQALVDTRQMEADSLARQHADSGADSVAPSPLDAFKSLLLAIAACPAEALSSHARTTNSWKILERHGDDDPFSMVLDRDDNLHVLSASGSSFFVVRIDGSQSFGEGPVVADVRGGHLPEGQRISSCALYEKSDAVLLTSVSAEGSHLTMIPVSEAGCPFHSVDVRLTSGPIDALVDGTGQVDLSRCRNRDVAGLEIVAPFAASATRGVALALYAPVNAITIYDLEEDDEVEEGESGSDDENVLF